MYSGMSQFHLVSDKVVYVVNGHVVFHNADKSLSEFVGRIVDVMFIDGNFGYLSPEGFMVGERLLSFGFQGKSLNLLYKVLWNKAKMFGLCFILFGSKFDDADSFIKVVDLV